MKSRNSLIGFAAAMAVTSLGWTASASATDSITVASWGGTLQDAQRKALFQPAAKALGIEIKEDSLDGLAGLRAQVMSGTPTWDIVELDSSLCVLAQAEGLTEPLDYNVIEASGVSDSMKGSNWIGVFVYATVLAWSEGEENAPKTWAEFFDADKFPIARSLYASPSYTMEAALLADGVAPKDLYPIDVDRALSVLERIKPKISAWWKTGSHSVQLMRDGEVGALAIWNGRISELRKEGVKVAYTFQDGIVDFDCLVIARGTKKKDLAMKALNEFLKAENQATFATLIDYGPVNTKAFDTGIISAERASELASAPENMDKMVVVNPTFWAENLKAIQPRFDQFIQE